MSLGGLHHTFGVLTYFWMPQNTGNFTQLIKEKRSISGACTYCCHFEYGNCQLPTQLNGCDYATNSGHSLPGGVQIRAISCISTHFGTQPIWLNVHQAPTIPGYGTNDTWLWHQRYLVMVPNMNNICADISEKSAWTSQIHDKVDHN